MNLNTEHLQSVSDGIGLQKGDLRSVFSLLLHSRSRSSTITLNTEAKQKGIRMEDESKWEHVDGPPIPLDPGEMSTWRLPVPGGWLFRTVSSFGNGYEVSMCFVPEPKGNLKPSYTVQR